MSNDPKKLIITELRLRYQKSTKKERGLILDEFCKIYDLNRKYAIRLINSKNIKISNKRGRKDAYSEASIIVLKKLWLQINQICSKNLSVALPEWLKHCNDIDDKTKKEITKMSPSTIDRRLSKYKAETDRHQRTGTKPGSLIKKVIPIVKHDHNVLAPGFVEADTVAHCGNSMSGEFAWTLTLTDIYSGWTENRAFLGKGSQGVLQAINDIENKLPFSIYAFNSDNGSEFLNQHIIRYLTDPSLHKNKIDVTRSRPYIKNDNAHVEQKNWSHVRQIFGYERFDDPKLIILMNELYSNEYSLLNNFFIPQLKLLRKERVGSKYKRYYSKPETPFMRIMNCNNINQTIKDQLLLIYNSLNPFTLQQQIKNKTKLFLKYLNKGTDNNNESNNNDDFNKKSVA
jgi:hypothetical protein